MMARWVITTAALAGLLLSGVGTGQADTTDAGPSYGAECSNLQASYKATRGKVSYDFETPRSGDPKVDAALAAFVHDLRDAAVKEGSANPPPADSAAQLYTYSLSCWVAQNGPKIASYIFSSYQFTGGAHGISAFHTRSYEKGTARELALTDLFADMDTALPALSKAAIAALEAQLKDAADPDWIAKGAGPEAANFTQFALGETELILLFEQYQVGAGYIGQQQVRLPYEKLDPLWSPLARTLLGRS